MGEPKVHYDGGLGGVKGFRKSLCGAYAPQLTNRVLEVTCRLCVRALESSALKKKNSRTRR